MIKILIPFIFISFFHANTHHYQIKLLGIDVAKVSMAHRDTVFAGHVATIVEFLASTETVSSFFYSVDYYYKIIHSTNTHQILSFKKITTQPGLYNELFTDLKDNLPYYHDSKVSIQNGSITIFTLFYLMAHDLLDAENFIIEREGLNYKASLLKLEKENNSSINEEETIKTSSTEENKDDLNNEIPSPEISSKNNPPEPTESVSTPEPEAAIEDPRRRRRRSSASNENAS